jgi:hypothetical protein
MALNVLLLHLNQTLNLKMLVWIMPMACLNKQAQHPRYFNVDIKSR